MFNLFKCKHHSEYLVISKGNPTRTKVDDDFTKVTFHLHCFKCGEDVDISCNVFTHGVEGFLNNKK